MPDILTALPEAASLVLSEWPIDQNTVDAPTRQKVQLEIYRKQLQLEATARPMPYLLCDRSTVDAASYWPPDPALFWDAVGSSYEAELARYEAVIYLESAAAIGVFARTAIRNEATDVAIAHGKILLSLWQPHRRMFFVPARERFEHKQQQFFEALTEILAGPG